jgi:predicted ATPase/class 3 adenylate cyclase
MQSLSSYIPQDRRIALAHGKTLPDRTYGSALFADISGFTPLAESLTKSLGTQRGAEELARQLNLVYDALITQVHNYRGSVIGFVGDAITCWFNEMTEEKHDSVIGHRSSVRATACALAMQNAMHAFPQLAIKIGIATGSARRFVVGDPSIQLIDTIVGETIRQMIQAESMAEKGEIVLAFSTMQDLGSIAKPIRYIDTFTAIAELTTQVEPTPWGELPNNALTQEQIRPWILPSLYERIQAEQEQFTTELRAATALFVQFEKINYDHDGDAGKKLDVYVRHAQRIVNRYEGNLIQLTIGDKGSFFYAVFGAPIAHDDDPVRAVQAAIELFSSLSETGESQKVGIAQGQMRVGAYGAQIQRTYGAIGDATNLAARLMQAAPIGEVRSDYNVYRSANKRIAFETLSPIRVKGKAELVRIYRPTSRQSTVASQQTEIIGRRTEIALLEKLLDDVQSGAPRVLIIEGEAGIGKSRLVDELKRLTRERGLTGLVGNGQSIEQQTPYRAWRDVFNSYFDLDNVTDANERRARVESSVAQLIPEHAQRLPVLNDVLGLGIPENDLTQSLDANLRQQNVWIVLTALLRAWTNEHPLILILEDAHWLDGLSWNLAIQIVRALALSNAPLLFVLVNRPLGENSAGHKVCAELREMDGAQSLALSTLAPDEIIALIANRLNVTTDALPAPLIELVQLRANGNPFFAEELIFNLRDTGVIKTSEVLETSEVSCRIIGDLETAQRTLPDTLHGLILSRIDRLPPQRQFVIKVAAVIGRAFTFAPLYHVVNQYVAIINESLKEHLASLTKADFTFLETLEPELTYLFKHIITQEAAYQTLLFEQRRELHHIVAEWYEDRGEGTGDREQKDSLIPDPRTLYPLLAYHYRYAEDVEKERYYLELAGEAAEKVYANDAAIGFYTHLLALIDPQEQADLLLKRGKIFELIGRWNETEQDYHTALTRAEQIQNTALVAESQYRLGAFCRLRGNYPAALDWLNQAETRWKTLGDLNGTCQVRIEQGNVRFSQGNLAQARQDLEDAYAQTHTLENKSLSARALNQLAIVERALGEHAMAQAHHQASLALWRELGFKPGIGLATVTLGTLFYNQGDLTMAHTLYKESLGLFREIGNKGGMVRALTNLGAVAVERQDYATAQAFFEESITLNREMDNKTSLEVAINNLGDTFVARSNYAMAHKCYAESLALAQAIGNKTRVASVLGRMGNLALRQRDYSAAQTHFQSGLALLREVGNKREIADMLNGLGILEMAQGNYANARTWLEESLTHYRQIGNALYTAIIVNNMALAMIGQGDDTTARTLYQESLPIIREHRPNYLPYILIGLTSITVHRGSNADATRFSAAIETWRDSASIPLNPFILPFHERNLVQARAALTPDEFDAAWAQGTQLSIDQAIDEAIKVTENV